MKDGEIISDSNPLTTKETHTANFSLKKTAMSFLTALKLSFNNIKTKKGRTALTAFASSIGIIGIALILSLSNGFKIEVDNFEQNSLAQSPIVITSQAMQMDEETMRKVQGKTELEKYPDQKIVYAQDDMLDTVMHNNKITQDYIDYLSKMDKENISGFTYEKGLALNLIRKDQDDTYVKVDMGSGSIMENMQLLVINAI